MYPAREVCPLRLQRGRPLIRTDNTIINEEYIKYSTSRWDPLGETDASYTGQHADL